MKFCEQLMLQFQLSVHGVLCAGNDNLHLLTMFDKFQRLRVDLADFEGNTAYAEYDIFIVASESDDYTLSLLGKYNGTAGAKSLIVSRCELPSDYSDYKLLCQIHLASSAH